MTTAPTSDPAQVRCAECAHLNLRDNPAMAAARFGRCEKGERFMFHSAVQPRACAKFHAAPEAITRARLDWLAKRTAR